ncbi:MAG: hypothetical protein HQL65_18205 [Magnetococcales bacterium]|nr:hypothetical protein [Magnetococcales bacterium]
MDISLSEAAIILGKTPRQVRYLIKTGVLAAHKENGCWVIANVDLPLTDAQRQAMARRAETAQHAMAEATAPLLKVASPESEATEKVKAASPEPETTEKAPTEGDKGKKNYSVTDLRAFTLGAEIYRAMENHLGRENPARECLFTALKMLCRGCHAFQPAQKETRFTEARESAADAVAFLFLEGDAHDAQRTALAKRIETELIPKLAALAASQEKRNRLKRREGLGSFFPGPPGE